MNGWYITSTGERGILEPAHTINLTNKDLIELVIPDGVVVVWCWNNKLTKLDLPDSVKYIYCWNNQLTELIVPDGCDVIGCDVIGCDVIYDPHVKLINRTMYNRSKRLKQILK